MARLKVGVYDPGSATGPPLEGVLRSWPSAGAEFRALGRAPTAPPRAGATGADEWLDALVNGDVDLAICPLDAVRATLDDKVEVVGVPGRGDPRDALLGAAEASTDLASLPPGAAVAVPDLRAAGLLGAHRRDLAVVPAGELADDLAQVDAGGLDAVVTSLHRVAGTSYEKRTGQVFSLSEWVPAPGQGALAILAHRDRAVTLELGEHLVQRERLRAVRAELAAARQLGLPPGCGLGVVGLPFRRGLRLRGMVTGDAGRQVVRAETTFLGKGPTEAGVALAHALRRRGAELCGGPSAWPTDARERSSAPPTGPPRT